MLDDESKVELRRIFFKVLTKPEPELKDPPGRVPSHQSSPGPSLSEDDLVMGHNAHKRIFVLISTDKTLTGPSIHKLQSGKCLSSSKKVLGGPYKWGRSLRASSVTWIYFLHPFVEVVFQNKSFGKCQVLRRHLRGRRVWNDFLLRDYHFSDDKAPSTLKRTATYTTAHRFAINENLVK